MAKIMARIENGVVVNIEWWSDEVVQTKTLIDIEDRPVDIGNTYVDGKFYDNGVEVITEIEYLQRKLVEYGEELAELDAALLDAQYNNLMEGL